jgi:hypothetical protein
MSAYQHEAAKARAPYTSLSPGASRSARYARRHRGVVGVGTRDQTLAATSPQVSGGVSVARLSREAHSCRWACLLPSEPVAAPRSLERYSPINTKTTASLLGHDTQS